MADKTKPAAEGSCGSGRQGHYSADPNTNAFANSSQEEEERRSFTSMKLRVLDAMSFDPALQGDVFRFAFRVIQHVNSFNGVAWPTIDRLAAQMGISRKTAMRHAATLVELGWVAWHRPNRRAAFEYRFRGDRVNQVLDAMELRVELAKDSLARRKKPTLRVGTNLGTQNEASGPKPGTLSGNHGVTVTPYENYLVGTPSNRALEGTNETEVYFSGESSDQLKQKEEIL
jgi:Helix-turn-helix domain